MSVGNTTKIDLAGIMVTIEPETNLSHRHDEFLALRQKQLPPLKKGDRGGFI
jgi:hypothetical protein